MHFCRIEGCYTAYGDDDDDDESWKCLLDLLGVVRRERRWHCASWSMTGNGTGSDSSIQNRMHRLCHRCGIENWLQKRLWSCVDELDERLPPDRSWCRRLPSPHHTPPATLLCRLASLAEQEKLSTFSMLPLIDQRSAFSDLQLAVPAATLSIEYSAGVGWTASGWHGRLMSAGAAWLNAVTILTKWQANGWKKLEHQFVIIFCPIFKCF